MIRDVLCIILGKKYMEMKVTMVGKHIITLAICMVAGLLIFHIALILVAIFLYNYFISISLTATISALISSIIFIITAFSLFIATYRTISFSHHKNSSSVLYSMLYAFLQGMNNNH